MALLEVKKQEQELILNTPNRNEILKQGPPQQTKANLLGKGTFGTVFKAIYKGKQVAVKVVKNDLQLNTLLNESNVVGWNHRNIVKIIKIESTPNYGIIIMERFPGYCLQAVLDSHIELSVAHRAYIALDILAAMRYCHKQQLLHLDIKPQNVLVVTRAPHASSAAKRASAQLNVRGYTCKLCDFGASQRYGENKENAAKCGARGTVRYMAPEALREQPLTPAADIYSLGITMWQLQYKRIPYYWLECNEIVAYQVVKHQLRPHARASYASTNRPRHKLSVVQHEHCYCNSALDTHRQSYQTVEQLKSMLKTVDFSVSVGAQTAAPHPGGPALKRKPLQLLSSSNMRTPECSSKNVARHLAFDTHAATHACQNNATASSVAINNGSDHNAGSSPATCVAADDSQLLRLFAPTTKLDRANIHQLAYEAIYKSCWHADYLLRPRYTELRMRLGQLL